MFSKSTVLQHVETFHFVFLLVSFEMATHILSNHPRHQKNALYLNVNVFSTNLLIKDTIFTSSTGEGTATLLNYPSHEKVSPFTGRRKYLYSSVILRPRVIRPRTPPALELRALPTQQILLLLTSRLLFVFYGVNGRGLTCG